jgi:1-acyl-sn-glycerol-3-phosphate acyltransferase
MARTRILIWYFAVWSYFVLTYPVILLARYLHNSGRLAQRDALAYIMMIPFARLTFYMSGSRLKITGKENIPKNRPVVFVSNHQGHMDSLIIHGFIRRPKGFVTITKFQKTPILRTWMKYMGCVFLDKSDIRQSLGCINQAADNLKRGLSMVVFPEGKLNDGKETLKFEKGWLRLVTKSGVPVVPITLRNTYKALSYNGKGMHPTKIDCIISKPIETYNIDKANENEFMQNLRTTILAQL